MSFRGCGVPSGDSRLLLRQEVEKERAEDVEDVGLMADHIPGDMEKSLGGSMERMGNRLDKRINKDGDGEIDS